VPIHIDGNSLVCTGTKSSACDASNLSLGRGVYRQVYDRSLSEHLLRELIRTYLAMFFTIFVDYVRRMNDARRT
jgi:hypothetical protein